MAQERTVDIMGSTYKIVMVESKEEEKEKYPHLVGNYGILLSNSKTILIENFDYEETEYSESEGGLENNLRPFVNATIRHEVLHAYLNECGLKSCAMGTSTGAWSRNEEMVDWFANVSPKIFKTYSELGVLE